MRGHTIALLALAAAQRPNIPPGSPDIAPTWAPTWVANESSYLYWCNWTGPVYAPAVSNWSITSLDWSDWKWGAAGWAAAQPMDAEERLYADAVNIVASSAKALPFFRTVREKLADPAYSAWFMPYAATPPINGTSYFSPPCDPNNGKCSTLYHDSTQSPDYAKMPRCPITGDCSIQVPGYPLGDGICAAPACDVGAVPVGEYVFDPRAWNVSVNGQTLGQWWVEDYLFGEWGAMNPNITGFYFDDAWSAKGCSEMDATQLTDMGLTEADVAQALAAYNSNMAELYTAVVARGAYTEQQFTKVSPPRSAAQCAALLRSLCQPSGRTPPALFVSIDDSRAALSMAVFLLARGPHAWYGHTWQGCGSPDVDQPTTFPQWHAELFDASYGEPVGGCAEVGGTGVFRREWTGAEVAVNCSDEAGGFAPSIVLL